MRTVTMFVLAALCAVGPVSQAFAAGAAPEGAAPGAEAPAGPSREEIARRIAAAESARGGGIAVIVLGGLSVIGGWVSFLGEVADEDDRDQQGYPNCYSGYGCPEDEKEEPEVTGLAIGVLVGAGLIAAGTVTVVNSSREANRLRRQERRLKVGFDPATGATTVGWNF